MNRLNQTEPASFSVLLCWALFTGSIFSCILDINYAKKREHRVIIKNEEKEKRTLDNGNRGNGLKNRDMLEN